MVMQSSISSAGCLRAFFKKSLMGSDANKQCAKAVAPRTEGETAGQDRGREPSASNE